MSLHAKTVLLFLAVAIPGVLVCGLFAYLHGREALIEQTVGRLETVAAAQERAIEALIAAQKERVALVASRDRLRRFLAVHPVDAPADNDEMNRILTAARDAVHSMRHLSLLSAEGVVAASSDATRIGARPLDREFLLAARDAAQIFAVAADDGSGIVLRVVAPARYMGFLVGFALASVRPDELYSIVNDYSGLGTTGETLLARRSGDGHAQFLTPVRHRADAALTRLANRDRAEVPMVQALAGRETALLEGAVDYSGAPVLAVTRHLEELDWGLVAKLHMSEVRAPVVGLGLTILLFALLLSFAIVAVGPAIAGHITRPIDRLAMVAARVREGDLGARANLERGDEIGFLAQAFDQMTDQLVKTNDRLEEANRDLDQFTYIASHDLKAPLRAVDHLADWIAEDLGEDMPESVAHNLARMRERVRRLERLIEDILAYSRAGRLGSTPERVDTGALVSGIASSLAPPSGLRIVVGDDLPVLDTARTPLETVLRNLVSNAIKHHDRDTGEIRVEGRIGGAFVEFRVVDDGPGIPPEYHERVFQMFQTLESKRDGASGVGLALVKRLITLAGGQIRIHSTTTERGTTFEFTWPRAWHDYEEIEHAA